MSVQKIERKNFCTSTSFKITFTFVKYMIYYWQIDVRLPIYVTQ